MPRKRAEQAGASGSRHEVAGPFVDAVNAALPFSLTGVQRNALAEIGKDLAEPAPMHRRLQGDVGSGKTVIALAALLVAVQGGYQGAFMAPTEVLAEQHYLGSLRMLEGLTVPAEGSLLAARPVGVALSTNRHTPAVGPRLTAGPAPGPTGPGRGPPGPTPGTTRGPGPRPPAAGPCPTAMTWPGT